MLEILLGVAILIGLVNLVIGLQKKRTMVHDIKPQLREMESRLIKFDSILDRMERSIRDEFHRHRNDVNTQAKTSREELSRSLGILEKRFSENAIQVYERISRVFDRFAKQQVELNRQSSTDLKEIRGDVEKQLRFIREDNTKQLDEMRKTVDEKLQKTINERLNQSFQTVSHQLKNVQEGLGEMRTLASDVGGLKKVLSNVKMRGGFGEIQLAMLLEQVLAPEQYEANVKIRPNSQEQVEFAVKLPGREDSKSVVWLPIDAKFPREVYMALQEAYENGDADAVASSQKQLEITIKKMAKDISSKYLDPPTTTDFGIMFLPFEGIYAEVVRNATLLEELQKKHKIIVTGPTTLAAILNSLQIGFKTLAIQKRSSEVWQILGSVKNEFKKFGGLMKRAQNNIQTGLDQLDGMIGQRTRAIQRKLKHVEALNPQEGNAVSPGIDETISESEPVEKQKKSD